MITIDCVQGTPEWHAVKRGIPSASDFDKIVTMKGERSKSRDKYLYQLAGESIINLSEESYQNEAMISGLEREAEARIMYEMMTGNPVVQVGFCLADGYGCSPDGLVGDTGLLEIKSPKLATHIGYLMANELPSDYFQQTQGQLLVTGRAWVDFMSYYPGIMPLILRVTPNDIFLKKLDAELRIFCADLQAVITKIGGNNGHTVGAEQSTQAGASTHTA